MNVATLKNPDWLNQALPCGRKFGDLRGDELEIMGVEMQRIGKMCGEAEEIMKKGGPTTTSERRLVAHSNALLLFGNPDVLALLASLATAEGQSAAGFTK